MEYRYQDIDNMHERARQEMQEKYHLIIMQDGKDLNDLYDAAEFVNNINNFVNFVSEDPDKNPDMISKNMRSVMYRLDGDKAHNEFVGYRTDLLAQIANKQTRELLKKHLPVLLPDIKYFRERWNKLSEMPQTPRRDQLLLTTTQEFCLSMAVCSVQNRDCSKLNGILPTPPKSKI